MALSIDELRLLQQSVEDAAMQRKKIRTRPKTKPTKKQKKIEHLTDKQAKELKGLQLQMGTMLHQNSNIIASRKKDENTPTKRDLRKGHNNNQGVEKIHSESSMEDLLKLSNQLDRKSTRLNSSHVKISYAVFCLKKKKNKIINHV